MTVQTANVPTALTLNTFMRPGYAFSGWNTLANGTGTAYADGALYAFAADVTLYAQWTALPAAPVVSIGPSRLTWSSVTNATGYQVYQSTEPYFTPSGSPPEQTDRWYDLPGDTTNYYYIVRAVNGPARSDNSNRVGRFSFALTPGQ
jgi:uncharacterized repeat protein (TIGR02543 family)